jgi:hypothetical protein
MLTLGHFVRQTAPWIMGISLTGFAIYCVTMLIRYWNSDSWALTSGKVEQYDKPTWAIALVCVLRKFGTAMRLMAANI